MTVTGNYNSVALLIMAPAILTENVYIKVAEKAGGTFRTLRSNQTEILLEAGMADQIVILTAAVIRLHATGGVGGDRVFHVIGSPRP
jgi:hypothetical protein